jgi:hypothetical protein
MAHFQATNVIDEQRCLRLRVDSQFDSHRVEYGGYMQTFLGPARCRSGLADDKPNPFFIEEIVQALFDEGALVRNGAVKVTRSLSQLRLPPTVQGILAARIDRLSAEQKELLQTLAVIGRESPLALIKKIVSTVEARLERMLSELRAAEFICEQPTLAAIEYVFKHALIQEVAYNSLLIERRKQIHGDVGSPKDHAGHPSLNFSLS